MKLDILVHQKRHPRRRHNTHHARHQAPIEAAQALLAPDPGDDAAGAAAEALVRVVVLQAAAHDLIRVRGGAGDELGAAGDDDGGLGAHGGGPAGDAAPAQPAAVVCALQRLVDGKLHGAVRDANERDAQAAVEAQHALGAQDGARAGRHGRVRAVGAVVRGQHARLEHPDRVGEHRRGRAGEGAGDKVVARRGPHVGAGAVALGEESLEAGLEEEKGRPAGGVADEVRRQAAV